MAEHEILTRDVETALTVLLQESRSPNLQRLKDDIEFDHSIMDRARDLTGPVREKINEVVRAELKIHRDLAAKMLPPGTPANALDFSSLTERINDTAETGLRTMGSKALATLARVKRKIARNEIQPLLVAQVDQEINTLIDGNTNEKLEPVIEIVLSYLIEKVLARNADKITFFLVNEENQYEQIDHLTEVAPGTAPAPISRKDFDKGREHLAVLGEKDHLHGNRLIEDYEHDRLYLELNIKGLDLGLLQIDLKPGRHLDPLEMKCLLQAASRLDSKIDGEMKTRRLALIARKAHQILDEHGSGDDFEEGIAEFMVFVCRYSTAFEADVFFDIFGDGEDFFAMNFNDNGTGTPLKVDESIKAELKIPSSVRKLDDRKVLMTDIEEVEGRAELIGKVCFRTNKETDELRNEDRTLLNFCAEMLHSHIRAWRKDLQLRIEGVDPQIARTTLRGGIRDTVKETITALYTDISGFTNICELVEDALGDDPDTMEDVETFKGILSEVLNLVQETGQAYGGVWDKAVGDMGLMEFGIPIDGKGLDPLGNDNLNRHPDHFAVNALKTSLLIRHHLDAVTDKFRRHLIKLACRKYGREESTEELSPEEQNALLDELKDEIGLIPKIATTTSVFTGRCGYTKLPLGAASDWTGIGDTMNTAARIQASSGKMEIRVPLMTRDLVWPLINWDTPVPLDKKGQAESWSQFLREKLGFNPERVETDFVECYEGHRNKSGRSAVFTLTVKEKDPEVDAIRPKSTLAGAQLLKYEGEEFGIDNRNTQAGNEQLFFLHTVTGSPEKNLRFRALISPGDIEERVTKYASPRALAVRRMNGTVNSLVVQDGRFKEFTWKSIDEDQHEQLTELGDQMKLTKNMVIIAPKLIPGGCYILNAQEDSGEKNFDILTIVKDSHIFKARIHRARIHEGAEPVLKNRAVLYDFQSYYETIRGQTTPGQPVVFVHKRRFYKVTPEEAETMIMPVETSPVPKRPSQMPVSMSSPLAGISMIPPFPSRS